MQREEENVQVVQALYQAFGEQDLERILSLMVEDVEIRFYGPSEIPYAGRYRGRDEARKFFEMVAASVDVDRFEPLEFIAQGDQVAVTGALRLRARSTGRVIESDFAHIIDLRGGLWTRFRDFMDTAAAVHAFAPGG